VTPLRPLVLLALLPAAAASSAALTPLRGGPFEASGVAAIGAGGVLIVDDGRPGEVLWLPLAADGSAGEPRPVAIGVSVADPEGITTDGTWVYVAGSLSRGTGASLARFRFDSAKGTASGAESMTGLEPLLRSAVPQLAADGGVKKKKAEAALNIEGLAWDPKGARLLLGIRSPVIGGSALVVPLRLKDAARPLAADNVAVEAPLRVDLGGSGFRGFEYDAAAGAFQIVAGHPTGARDFRLVSWDGVGPAVREIHRFAPGEKPEGVAATTIGGKPATVVVFDTSHYMVLP
jgi:uncharacterized protein DUF3616